MVGANVDRKIWRLWARWMPRLLARRISSTLIPELTAAHRDWCLSLLRSGLSVADIRRTNLDSPFHPDQDRQMVLQDFLRRRRRMWRTRQKGRND